MKNIIPKIGIIFTLFGGACIEATSGVSAAQNLAVALQSDGSIVAAGTVTFNNVMQLSMVRYTSLGIADVTYGNSGYAITAFGNGAQANGIAILSNNEAIAIGYGEPTGPTSCAIALYTTSGVLDTSFNGTGTNTTLIGQGSTLNGVAIDANGNYVTAGVGVTNGTPVTALVRYNSSGILDTTFGTNGVVTTLVGYESYAQAVALQSNGQIVVAGYADVGSPAFTVARYNSSNGSLDTTFNSTGTLPGTVTTVIGSTQASAYATAIDASGNILAAGSSDDTFALVRYTSTGTLDTTFGSGGIVTTTIAGTSSSRINGITLQPNGQIVVVGYAGNYLALARYNTNGSLDTTFNSSGSQPGVVTTSINEYAEGTGVVLNSSGQIIVVGFTDQGGLVIRYNTTGLVDTTFGTNGFTNFPNSTAGADVFGLTSANLASNAGILYSQLDLTNSIMNSDINANAAIADTKLATIQTPGTVLNSATTATNLNTANAIVSRDSLGNFVANSITSNLVGDVTGAASLNVLSSGGTMTGTLMLPAGSAANPSLQFSGSTNLGLSSPSTNYLTLSTNGVGALSIDGNGAVSIATPGNSEVGLTVNGGGAQITGALSTSSSIVFNTAGTSMNAVGSTQPSLKIYTGSGNTGVLGLVTINYSAAGFTTAPTIFISPVGGVLGVLGLNSITSTSATGLSSVLSVPFNYVAIGV